MNRSESSREPPKQSIGAGASVRTSYGNRTCSVWKRDGFEGWETNSPRVPRGRLLSKLEASC